jgi:hypothetical protein
MEQSMASARYTDRELKGEPSLDELFEEPIVQLIMQRDGVKARDMREELDRLLASYATQPAV